MPPDNNQPSTPTSIQPSVQNNFSTPPLVPINNPTPPPTVPPKSHSLLITLLIILVPAVIAGLWYWQLKSDRDETTYEPVADISNNTEFIEVPIITPNPSDSSPSLECSSERLVYRNEKWNFEFDYPTTWPAESPCRMVNVQEETIDKVWIGFGEGKEYFLEIFNKESNEDIEQAISDRFLATSGSSTGCSFIVQDSVSRIENLPISIHVVAASLDPYEANDCPIGATYLGWRGYTRAAPPSFLYNSDYPDKYFYISGSLQEPDFGLSDQDFWPPQIRFIN